MDGCEAQEDAERRGGSDDEDGNDKTDSPLPKIGRASCKGESQ